MYKRLHLQNTGNSGDVYTYVYAGAFWAVVVALVGSLKLTLQA